MAEIPESLLRRSAEAKAKALGLPVEQVLAEMKGEAPPSAPETVPPERPEAPAGTVPVPGQDPNEQMKAAESEAGPAAQGDTTPAPGEVPEGPEAGEPAETPEPPPAPAGAPDAETPASDGPTGEESRPAAAVVVEERPTETPGPGGNGRGNGKAAVVTPRPMAPPANAPEGVRTQRLLTVVKARAIQQVKSEPTDKVNTWPHLMIAEFTALLAMTGFLLILSVIIQSPLLDPANFNATPNPSKAPWYFLGLQELLSYFDPQVAGVMVPTFVGLIGFMMIPFVDRNPSTNPSDRKVAIMLYTFFLAGAATLTILGVLFRGHGFNFSYPWKDGVFFDDLKDWVQFE